MTYFAELKPTLKAHAETTPHRQLFRTISCSDWLTSVTGLSMPEAVLTGLAEQRVLLETLLRGCVLDDDVLNTLNGQFADGNFIKKNQRSHVTP